MPPALSRLLPLAGLLLTGCAVVTLATPRASWPQTDGQITVTGLTAPVAIRRDEWGVPHIRAQSEADALYGQGFVHAQDRMFQADLARRLAFGRLAEWRGESAVRLDRFMRGLELERRSKEIYEATPAGMRAGIDAYTAGFNAGMKTAKAPPVEHRLIGHAPEAWRPWDCMALVWLNAWNLAENYPAEIAAFGLRDLSADEMDALFRFDPTEPPADPRWDQTRKHRTGAWTPEFEDFDAVLGLGDVAAQRPAGSVSARLQPGGGPLADLAVLGRRHYPGLGSNNWIIGGARSASGKPIVANDPHLHQMAPSLWYAVDIGAPDLHAAGFSLPGAPFVTLGHNGEIAWGFTNVMADTVDFAVLQRDGDGYLWKGERRAFRAVDAPVTLDDGTVSAGSVLWTEVGPVVSAMDAPWVVAMKWHALDVADETTRLIRTLNVAHTVDDALQTRDIPSMVAQNLVVADSSGDYAWQPFGSLPVREGWEGRLPWPAGEEGYRVLGQQTGLIPGERRPARGYVASANARPPGMTTDAAAGFPAWKVSTRFFSSHRHRRIQQLIEATPLHTPETVAAMQRDRFDLQAAELLPILLPQTGSLVSREPGDTCERLLRAWDRRQEPDSIGATVWNLFQLELLRVALQPRLGASLTHYLSAVGPGTSLLDGRRERFLPDLPAAASVALDRTCDRLIAERGADVQGWAWGGLHPLSIQHPFSSASPLLQGWSRPTVPYGGSINTLNVGTFDWRDRGEYPVGSVPSMRMIMPIGALSMSRFSHPGGASGHARNPHAEDMFRLWLAGDSAPLRFEDSAVRAGMQAELTLVPAAPR